MTDARDLERRRYEEAGVTDYRSMFDSDYLGAWDLMGRDVVVTIAKVTPATVTGQGGRKARKPLLHFEGKSKGLVIGKTIGRTIADMYGKDVDAWIGKKITLYATDTTVDKEKVDCIRVRPTVPKQAREPGQEG